MPGPAISQLRRLLELEDERDRKKQEYDEADQDYKSAELEVHEALEGLPGAHKYDLGEPYGVVSFQSGETIYGHVYDQGAFEKWAHRAGRAKDFFSAVKVNKKPLNQLVRRSLQQSASMPDGVEHRRTRYVTTRRPRAS